MAEAAFEAYTNRYTRILAGRAWAMAGDEAPKRRYAKLIKDNCEVLPNVLVWDAIDGLFPHFLDVDDLLDILSTVDISDADGGAWVRVAESQVSWIGWMLGRNWNGS